MNPSFPTLRGVYSARSIGTVARRCGRSLPKAVVNSQSPAANFWSITTNPVATLFQSALSGPTAERVIAANLPLRCKLRLAIDAPRTHKRLASRIFSRHAGTSSRGTNFSGGIVQALRSLLSRYPLVPVSPKTTRGSFQGFVFSPVLSSVPVHASNKAWSSQREVPRKSAFGSGA